MAGSPSGERGWNIKQQLELFIVEGRKQGSIDVTPYGIPIYRVALVREGTLSHYGQLRNSVDVSRLLWQHLADTDREHFVVFLLDRKNNVIGFNTVSIGSLKAATVRLAEVFKPAILDNASAIICGHNHPSGDPAPSPEDRAMTKQLVDGGKLLGIEVLDHIIVGHDGFYSFADDGAL